MLVSAEKKHPVGAQAGDEVQAAIEPEGIALVGLEVVYAAVGPDSHQSEHWHGIRGEWMDVGDHYVPHRVDPRHSGSHWISTGAGAAWETIRSSNFSARLRSTPPNGPLP